ncbi:MAG: adenylyltransferase/cytidyltransferase family protein [Alphaproteobacteria bacterium]|nr:adenylyltransferase/cytidyltransferase family protein [Alphaproteobacteria bacterium]
MSTVFTVGVFDLFHYGHKELFRRAKETAGPGGKLIVAVQDGNSILKYKPEAKIVYTTQERVEMVEQCRYVDQVVLYTDVDKIVRELDFDIFVLGGDQTHAGFQRAEQYCLENGRKVFRLPRTKGVSATVLRERLKGLE